MKTITLIEALIAAESSLKLWGEYGKEMKKHGRGTDCTQTATGYSNDYFLSVINCAIQSETKKDHQAHLILETLKAQRDIANSRATNALIERDMLKN